MKTNIWEILCVLIAALLLVSSFSIVADATKDYQDRKGKGPKKIFPGHKQSGNMEPVVSILSPTETYVSGDVLIIAVSVEDEDMNAIPVITVDFNPTFNTGNVVSVDISGWESASEHFISAVYEDSGGMIGGDTQYLIKL